MKKISRISRIFNVIVLFFVTLVFLYIHQSGNNNNEDNQKINNFSILEDKEKVIAIKVIDGDTIKCRNLKSSEEFKVRLISIDTPESSYNEKLKRELKNHNKTNLKASSIIKMGLESKNFTEKLVNQSKYLYLEYDIQLYDKYNRRLAYVYLDNGQMLNYILVREGYAKVYTIPPNIKYQEKLLQAQKLAQKEKKGLWKDI